MINCQVSFVTEVNKPGDSNVARVPEAGLNLKRQRQELCSQENHFEAHMHPGLVSGVLYAKTEPEGTR